MQNQIKFIAIFGFQPKLWQLKNENGPKRISHCKILIWDRGEAVQCSAI